MADAAAAVLPAVGGRFSCCCRHRVGGGAVVLAYHASGCMQYEAALPWDAEMQPLSGVPCGCACVLGSELANHGWLAEHVSATAVISGVRSQTPPGASPHRSPSPTHSSCSHLLLLLCTRRRHSRVQHLWPAAPLQRPWRHQVQALPQRAACPGPLLTHVAGWACLALCSPPCRPAQALHCAGAHPACCVEHGSCGAGLLRIVPLAPPPAHAALLCLHCSRAAGSMGVPGLAEELAEPLLFCEMMVFGRCACLACPEGAPKAPPPAAAACGSTR